MAFPDPVSKAQTWVRLVALLIIVFAALAFILFAGYFFIAYSTFVIPLILFLGGMFIVVSVAQSTGRASGWLLIIPFGLLAFGWVLANGVNFSIFHMSPLSLPTDDAGTTNLINIIVFGLIVLIIAFVLFAPRKRRRMA